MSNRGSAASAGKRALSWKRRCRPGRTACCFLGVRDYGPNPITSTNRQWGEWEPIGAGMVCRREVAGHFAGLARTLPLAARLGRTGAGMMSGEDTLLAQCAHTA